MKYEIVEGDCTVCEDWKLYENKERRICSTCLRKERKAETNALKERKIYTLPQYSAKGKQRHDAIIKMKKEIGETAKDSNCYFCHGCGCTNQKLDNSHILSIRQRSDLATDKENINLFCRTCHENFESGDISKMITATFLKDLAYIKKHDNSRFNDILFKMIDYNGPDKRVKTMLGKIEKIAEFAE
jgi:hypothetical protein